MSDLVIGICIGIAATYLGSAAAFLAYWHWMASNAPEEASDPVEGWTEAPL